MILGAVFRARAIAERPWSFQITISTYEVLDHCQSNPNSISPSHVLEIVTRNIVDDPFVYLLGVQAVVLS
ncbi:hypothetical protein KCU87_g69, partial [Aureobasidium melanogenum]